MEGVTISRRLRSITPAILHGESRGWAYFDGPGGTQMIEPAIAAIADFCRTGLANRHAPSPAGDETEFVMETARAELRALFGAAEYEVVFGQNMTSLAFALGHAFARRWGRDGGAVVVTDLEHSANVDTWAQPFGERGVRTVSVGIDEDTLDLDTDGLEHLDTTGGVALVSATAAANAVGVKPDLAPVHAFARGHGALFVVDGVHATPHGPPDMRELDPDVYLCSAYKFYGPHVGVALVKKELAEELRPYKVAAAPDTGPEKLESGSQNHEAIAGLSATMCGLGRLVGRGNGEGARQALRALGESETELVRGLAGELRRLPGVRVYGHGAPEDTKASYVSTIAFTVDGRAASDVAQSLRRRGVFVTAGVFYANRLARRLGVDRSGGWLRVGISGYTSKEDVERLVASVAEAVGA